MQSVDLNEFSTELQVTLLEDIVCRKNQDGTIVIMKMDDSDLFYKIDGIAAEIWLRLEKKEVIRDIFSAIMDDYDVAEEKLKEDMLIFLKDLLKNELITVQAVQ